MDSLLREGGVGSLRRRLQRVSEGGEPVASVDEVWWPAREVVDDLGLAVASACFEGGQRRLRRDRVVGAGAGDDQVGVFDRLAVVGCGRRIGGCGAHGKRERDDWNYKSGPNRSCLQGRVTQGT